MINAFQWMTRGVELPALDYDVIKRWIIRVAESHNRIVGELTYIFCNDEEILKVNREFLNHDYYTDIITFDSTTGRLLRGDIFISIDTIKSNSEGLKCSYENELYRVIIHGVLHLCGINDKAPGERQIMEREEDEALECLMQMK